MAKYGGLIVIEERVVEYFTRGVPETMRGYDTRRLELLAVVSALDVSAPKLKSDALTCRLIVVAWYSFGTPDIPWSSWPQWEL